MRLFLSLSASLSLFSALTLSSHAHLWSLKLSLTESISTNDSSKEAKHSRTKKYWKWLCPSRFHLNDLLGDVEDDGNENDDFADSSDVGVETLVLSGIPRLSGDRVKVSIPLRPCLDQSVADAQDEDEIEENTAPVEAQWMEAHSVAYSKSQALGELTWEIQTTLLISHSWL